MLNRISKRTTLLGFEIAIFLGATASTALARSSMPRTFDFEYRINGTYSPSVFVTDNSGPENSPSAPPAPERVEVDLKGTWTIFPATDGKSFRHRFKLAKLWQAGVTEEKLADIRENLENGVLTDINPVALDKCDKTVPALRFRIPEKTDRMARNLMIDILTSALTCLPEKNQQNLKYSIERTQGTLEVEARQGESPQDWSSSPHYREAHAPAPLAQAKSISDHGHSDWKLSQDRSRLESGTFRQDVKASIHGKEFSSFQSNLELRSAASRTLSDLQEIRADWGVWTKADAKLFEDEAYLRISETESRRLPWEALEKAFRTQAQSSLYLPLRSHFTVQPDTLMRLKDRILLADPEGKEFGLIALAAARSPLAAPQARWINIAHALEKDSNRLIAWMTPLVSNPSPGREIISWVEKKLKDSGVKSGDSAVVERARFLLSVFSFRYRQIDPVLAARLLALALASTSNEFEKLGLMGNAGLAESLPKIGAAADSKHDLDIRIKAIDALRFIEGKAVTEKLVGLLADPREEDETRAAAAASLTYRALTGVIPAAKLIAVWRPGVSEPLQHQLIALIGKTANVRGSEQDVEAVKWLRALEKSPGTSDEIKRRARAALQGA